MQRNLVWRAEQVVAEVVAAGAVATSVAEAAEVDDTRMTAMYSPRHQVPYHFFYSIAFKRITQVVVMEEEVEVEERVTLFRRGSALEALDADLLMRVEEAEEVFP